MDNNFDDKKETDQIFQPDSSGQISECAEVQEETDHAEMVKEGEAVCSVEAQEEAAEITSASTPNQEQQPDLTQQSDMDPKGQNGTGEQNVSTQNRYTNPPGASQQYTNPSGASQQYTNPSGASQQYTNPSGASQQYTNPSGTSQQRPYQTYQQNHNNTSQQYANPQESGRQNGQGFQQDNYNYNVGNNTGYNYNYRDDEVDKSIMSMGDWFLTILPMIFPCLGIPLYFYWAFGSNVNPNRKNYCRVNLIILGVVFVIYILFFGVFLVAAGTAFNY